MSITFSINCDCPVHRAVCPWCESAMYGMCCKAFIDDETGMFWQLRDSEMCAHEKISVNVSNLNARDIVESLGLEFDYSGTINVSDLLGRTLLRAAMPLDEPRPAYQNGIIHTPARAEGYIAGRAGELTELCELAQKDGFGTISWS